MPLNNESGFGFDSDPDPQLDVDPDPYFFVIDLQEANKKQIFFEIFLLITF